MPSPASTPSALRAAAISHAGLKRENNEDRYHCDPERGLFMVVDGVGGHAAGETAAETALATIRTRLDRETGAPLDRLREAIALANNEVLRLARSRAEWQGMACVLTVALVRERKLWVGHVGDTRLYVYDRAGFRKVTHDHSPVGEREDRGELDEAEAMRHPRRNEIFRDVGSEPHQPLDEDFVETVEMPFGPDAALLICSDGLSDLVPSAELARLLAEHGADPAAAAEALVEAANAAGGKDNVTVVVATGPGFGAAVHSFPPPRVASASRSTSGTAPVSTSAPAPVTGATRWGIRIGLLGIGLLVGLGLGYAALSVSDDLASAITARLRPPQWTKTWHVGPDAQADTPTIGAALERAQAGDRIEVAPGVYRESLLLRGQVTLVSTTPRGAVLEPADSAGTAWTAIRVEEGATGLVSGFTVRGGGGRPLGIGVQVFGAAIDLENVEITGAAVAGVIFESGARATLRASYIHGNGGTGVVVRAEALPRLQHNVISDNGRTGEPGAIPAAAAEGRGTGGSPTARAVSAPPVAGVEVQAGGRPQFFGNIIADNAGEQVRGLLPDARADLIRDNIVGGPNGSRRETPQAPSRGATPRREGGGR